MAWQGYGMAWHDIVGVWTGCHGRGMAWYGMAWKEYGMAWLGGRYGMVWHFMAWHGMAW